MMKDQTQIILPAGYQLHWYEFGKVLGQGGFGITYTGMDTNLNQAIAIKEYFPKNYAIRDQTGQIRSQYNDENGIFDWGLRRFIEEAQTLARFKHPNIVRVYSVFEANGTAYMVMELEHGMNIVDAAKKNKIPDEDSLLAIIYPLLDGLDHIHEAGFIHRDIKPDNLLIRDDLSPVLIDFGSARFAIGDETQQLTAIISRGFAPIEQYGEGESKQGPWTDIYSLSATLYRIITGKMPTDALQRGTTLLEGTNDPFTSTHKYKSDRYSEQLLNAVDKALELNVPDRPKTISEWRNLFPEPKKVITKQPKARKVQAHALTDSVNTDNVETGVEYTPKTGSETGTNTPSIQDTKSINEFENSEREPVMPDKDLSELSILLVDDEAFVLNLTKRVLNKMGIDKVETANDGEDALQFLDNTEELPQLMICDLNMPGMDGVALLRHLGERSMKMGIIFVSGEDQRILQTAEALGKSHDLYILGSIQKPIKSEPLVKLLNNFEQDITAVSMRRIEPVTEKELLAGINGDAIELVYQPKVSISEKRLMGVEALARWRHPERGMLGPGAFIPLAEELGQIDILTDAVLHKAMAQGGEWRAEGSDIGISVNYSVDSLNRLDLPEYIVSIAEEQGMDPKRVTIEVTESRLMRDINSTIEILTRLRLKGLGLSIDDFGTGHSSMEQLKRVPFTELKIDRAFVNGASDDPSTRAILESSVLLGKGLDLKLVAEGTETQDDWNLVAALGCDEVQGYFVAKPMPGDDILTWKETWEQ